VSAIPATAFLQSDSFIYVLYIIAFSLFIQGLRGLAGPTTAVRGNRIAAVGMAIAVIATLLYPGEGNWGLIALGLALGVAVGVPAARNVKMTAMPQMVALFNGVGGGAVALISWVEFRNLGSTYGSHTIALGGTSISVGGVPTYVAIFSVFAAIVGSISFWGSGIAFGKLQGILPGRPIKLPGQAFINAALFAVCVISAVVLASGTHSQLLFVVGILLAAAVMEAYN
jgi:NAD(P) transhydrogenase subunit beta